MAGQFREIPALIKSLGRWIQAIDDDGDKGKRLSRCPTVTERLSQQQAAETLPVTPLVHSEPRQNGNRQHAAR